MGPLDRPEDGELHIQLVMVCVRGGGILVEGQLMHGIARPVFGPEVRGRLTVAQWGYSPRPTYVGWHLSLSFRYGTASGRRGGNIAADIYIYIFPLENRARNRFWLERAI